MTPPPDDAPLATACMLQRPTATDARVDSPNLVAALKLVELLGWRLFPLHGRRADSSCTCGNADCDDVAKHPMVRAWPTVATADAATVRAMFARAGAEANIAVATGARSRVVVLDVDGEDGERSLAAYEAKYGALPITLTVRTARGRHLYFAAGTVLIRNSAGKLGKGLDVRGEGGYVVAPGSTHASGHVYAWELGRGPDSVELAALPEWLVALLVDAPAIAPVATASALTIAPVGGTRYARAALEGEVRKVSSAERGTRNNLLNDAAFNLGTFVAGGALDADEVRQVLLSAALECGLPESSARATIRSGIEGAMRKEPRTGPTREAPRSNGHGSRSKRIALASGWESQLTVTARGLVTASAANLLAILRRDVAWSGVLALNERTGQVMLLAPPPWRASECEQWVQCDLRDSDVTRVAAWLETSRFEVIVSPGSEALLGAIAVAAEDRKFDPVRDYLGALHWDGAPRLDSLLLVYFSAVGDGDAQLDYLRAVGARALIAAVARVYEPGCKVDHVLVLVGPQGVGKSSAIEVLAGAEHFADSLPDLSSKDAADYLRGPWLVELSELDSLNRSQLSTYKAFLSRTHDRFRAAYGRTTQNHPRRCSFLASTNEDAFLGDVTGNRRFWPVTVGSIDLAALRRDRGQLWAEAVHRYRAGEAWHLDSARLVAAAASATEERQTQDPWRPAIEAYLAGLERVGVQDVLGSCLQLKLEQRGQIEANRVARVLRQIGWARHHVRDKSGRSTWMYCRPAERS